MEEHDDVYQQLLNVAFRYVSVRPRSEKELRDILQKKLHVLKTHNPIVLEKTIKRLRELGYVDDTKFVHWWIEQRQARKPIGSPLIIFQLMSKGIAKDQIEQILYSETENEQALAFRAVEKKLLLWKNIPQLQLKRKIYDFLGRRGFRTGVIYKIIDEVIHNKVQ